MILNNFDVFLNTSKHNTTYYTQAYANYVMHSVRVYRSGQVYLCQISTGISPISKG